MHHYHPFAIFVSGIIGGILTKRYGCRLSGILGGFAMSLGLFSSCWVKDIYKLFITSAIAGRNGSDRRLVIRIDDN